MKHSRAHPPEIIEAICALKGKQPARITGEAYGLTKNAVVGIWDRHFARLFLSTTEPTMVSDCLSPTARSLDTRPVDGCTYIAGDIPDGLYCCEPVMPGKSWCVHHYSICLIQPSSPRARPYIRQIASAA